MYGANPKNRDPVWPELDVDCPTCKANKGQPCAHQGQTTELPHNRRVEMASGASAPKEPSK